MNRGIIFEVQEEMVQVLICIEQRFYVIVPGHPVMRSTDALGRIYTVHPKNDECFYLRLLLVHVRGPTSFESLRTVNGIVCPTFRAACQELNLIENDTH